MPTKSSKKLCPLCQQPMGHSSKVCIVCHRTAKREKTPDRNECPGCGGQKMMSAKECQKCRLRWRAAHNQQARTARMKEFIRDDNHWHFFRLKQPDGPTQAAACVSNRRLGIKGCGLEKLHYNAMEQADFVDWSMQSPERAALLWNTP